VIPAVATRSDAVVLAEKLGEVGDIVKSAKFGYLLRFFTA
jgi:hypothetical protein